MECFHSLKKRCFYFFNTLTWRHICFKVKIIQILFEPLVQKDYLTSSNKFRLKQKMKSIKTQWHFWKYLYNYRLRLELKSILWPDEYKLRHRCQTCFMLAFELSVLFDNLVPTIVFDLIYKSSVWFSYQWTESIW